MCTRQKKLSNGIVENPFFFSERGSEEKESREESRKEEGEGAGGVRSLGRLSRHWAWDRSFHVRLLDRAVRPVEEERARGACLPLFEGVPGLQERLRGDRIDLRLS